MLIVNPTKAQAIWNTHIQKLPHFHSPEIPSASKALIVVTLPPQKDSTPSV